MTTSNRLPPAEPLLLAANGHACVAWWHAPLPKSAPSLDAPQPALPAGWMAGGALPLAAVLASSWGEEDISGYDGERALAAALAEGGIGTLRFEWPDSGDSSAASGDASVADLLAAFDAAADRARSLSGCDRLAFIGLRLGALLAAQAAAARDDVDAFVGLLPVASGRVFVREQRMLGAALAPPSSDQSADARVMLGGFEIAADRAAALADLKWPTATATTLRDALLLSPPDVLHPPAADALARMGARVDEWRHRDLSNTLAIAHQADLAPAAVAEVVRWLRERAEDAIGGHVSAGQRVASPANVDEAAWLHTNANGMPVRERLVRIGTDDVSNAPLLAAVLSERDAPTSPPPAMRRGIVLLSSGRERRIGPHRLWVPFARARAARGDVVLRLDIAGVGDSAARAQPDPDGTPELYDRRCVDDVARAIEFLRREHGVGPCSVMGVCSGAFHAWRVALEGVDVQQVVAINPLVFHWRKGASLDPRSHAFGQIDIAAKAGRSMLDPARWWKLLTGRANVGVITGALAARARHAVRLRGRALARLAHWPLRDDLAAELARTCRRGVALHFVFSSREPGLTLLREESGRRGMRLRRDRSIDVCEVEHADHTFAGTAGRAGLYARLDLLLQPVPSMNPVPVVPMSRAPATARP
jgi:dienelactone hydrolase